MFVDGFDKSWFSTPFMKHRFLITEEKQLAKIRKSTVKSVFIDTKKGLDVDDVMEKTIVANTGEDNQKGEDIEPSKGTTEFETYVKEKEKYMQIDSNSLLEGSFIDFSIFIKNGIAIYEQMKYNGIEIEIAESLKSVSGELLIKKTDIVKYKKYLSSILSNIPKHLSQQKVKSTIIKENAKLTISQLLDNPDHSERMQECKTAVEDIIGDIVSNNGVLTHLLTINKHDYYTYTHSVNACIYAIGVAMDLGVKKDDELFAIGIGTLLHDIGKSTIPSEILNKPVNRLSDFELNILKQHVKEGYKIIKMFRWIPEGSYYPLLQHHEKLSGKGYPDGIKENDIHLYGKIASIVNLYDTLTTSRPGFKAITPFEALSVVRSLKDDYDMDIFRNFITLLGKSN